MKSPLVRIGTCLLIGPGGLSEVIGGQEPSGVQNTWSIYLPGCVVLLLSKFQEHFSFS